MSTRTDQLLATGAATPASVNLGTVPPSTASEKPVLSAEQVTLAYGRRIVLSEVNLAIQRGEFWAFLGPNGEGKSTLIKALLGAIQPMRGKIFLRADFQQRTRLALVPQECEVNPSVPTTVREFVLGGLVGISLNGTQQDARLRGVLDLMTVSHLRERSLWTLSGGQRQRALVARALIRDPLLLIVDEPTAGLDLAAAASLLDAITSLSRDKGITIVFVTHDLGIAAQHATHAALFRGGKLTAGPLKEVFTPANLSRTFGVPVGVHHDDHGCVHVAVEHPSAASPSPQ
ncbi:MAG: ABC transporter ATP-binding protein [Verrucomicrobia bacterium]|nr:ABC transporter ATP-binding protein [Verrucomicrobiota bacterium]MBM3870470.1 ABC transporter ATP-binding protein [Verrucomicrobiota bacterium]